MPITAPPTSIARSSRCTIHGGVQPSISSGAVETNARWTQRSA